MQIPRTQQYDTSGERRTTDDLENGWALVSTFFPSINMQIKGWQREVKKKILTKHIALEFLEQRKRSVCAVCLQTGKQTALVKFLII